MGHFFFFLLTPCQLTTWQSMVDGEPRPKVDLSPVKVTVIYV
jgi:hypothetical protein